MGVAGASIRVIISNHAQRTVPWARVAARFAAPFGDVSIDGPGFSGLTYVPSGAAQ